MMENIYYKKQPMRQHHNESLFLIKVICDKQTPKPTYSYPRTLLFSIFTKLNIQYPRKQHKIPQNT